MAICHPDGHARKRQRRQSRLLPGELALNFDVEKDWLALAHLLFRPHSGLKNVSRFFREKSRKMRKMFHDFSRSTAILFLVSTFEMVSFSDNYSAGVRKLVNMRNFTIVNELMLTSQCREHS